MKQTVMTIQEMNKECMMILQQKKVRLVNDVTSSRNPDYSSKIYLNADKVSQCRLVVEETKKKKSRKAATQKLHPSPKYM